MRTRLSALFATVLISLSVVTAFIAPGAHAQTAAPAASAPAAAASAPDAAAQPAAPAATPAAMAPIEKETVENPYGLEALWKAGDFVSRGTLIILIIMSMGSWYIIVTKLIDQARLKRQGKAAKDTFWTAASVDSGITTLDAGSPYRFIAESGNKSTAQYGTTMQQRVDMNTWISMGIQRAIERVQSRLQDGLAFLATVGSTAPFVGLFGTVWGIYHALTAIGIAGQASIDKVAGPVGEALIMTAIGLAVAVPAVLGYNWLVRRNKAAMEDVRSFSTDLHAALLSGQMTASESGRTTIVQQAG